MCLHSSIQLCMNLNGGGVVRFISPVAYVFERGTTGALSSISISLSPHLHICIMHDKMASPQRGSNERALILVCTWHQGCPSRYLGFNYGFDAAARRRRGRASGRVKTLPNPLLCATQSSGANRNINGGFEHL